MVTSTWYPMRSLVWRELARFYRQRSRIVGSLVSPLVFWVFLGSGLGSAFPSNNGVPYLEYFFPGVVVMTVLFASVFSNISIIEDRHEGFLQGVLVAPVSRFAVVGGKVFGGALIALFQGSAIFLLAPLAGLHLGWPEIVVSLISLSIIAVALTSLGFVFAWKLDSVQGFHSIMNVVLFPMWLLSGAFFPMDRAPIWLKPVMWLNPLSYGYASLRSAIYLKNPVEGLPPIELSLALSMASALVFVTAALIVVRKK